MAIVGAGRISEQHLKALATLGGRVRVVGISDLSHELGGYAVATFGVERSFTDTGAMLAETRPEVVHVLTPPHTHAAIVEQCLDAGAHVVCEKPVTPTRGEYERLRDIARGRGLALTENHNYLWNRPVRRIHGFIERGLLGEVREVEVGMTLDLHAPGGAFSDPHVPHPAHRLPAGALHDFLTHLLYLVGAHMERAYDCCALWRLLGPGGRGGAGSAFAADDLDAVLTGVGIAGPVSARVRFSAQQLPEAFVYRVRGTKGWAECDLFQPYVRLVTMQRPGPGKLASLVNHAAGSWALGKAAIGGFKDKLLQRTPYEGVAGYLDATYRALAEGGALPVDDAGISRVFDALEMLLAARDRDAAEVARATGLSPGAAA